ncbi:hypothetical protein WJ968_17805 [Achromobacter xylosoxidans]
MKKIIWIAFAALAALWTGFVALTLQLANWVLSLIAGSQVPGAAALGTAQWNPPAWAAPWVDPSWLKGLQESLVWAVQGLNQILPAAAAWAPGSRCWAGSSGVSSWPRCWCWR